MLVKILNVDVENVVKGKSRYSVATVAYMAGGEARTQKIMSFANPDVFKKVQELVGQETNVTVTKNDAGYNQWAAIGEAPASAPVAAPTGTPAARVTGSNYETPAERAVKQVYIVKQSAINASIALAGHNKEKSSPEDIVKTAQFFVDYVFDKDTSMESLQSDQL